MKRMENRSMTRKAILLTATLVLTGMQCRGYHYFMDMQDSPAVDAQQIDTMGNRIGNMAPPENSVAYQANPDTLGTAEADYAAAEKLVSPVKNNDPEILQTGRSKFNIYCAPCHGMTGRGDGPIKKKFGAIRPLVGTGKDRVPPEGWGAGRIFHVATKGIRSMSGYASQIREHDRWLVAHYVKYLQGQK